MLYQKEEELKVLASEFVSGNQAAFEQIARLITQDIVQIAYRYLGNIEEAKDAAQEVLIKLYGKLRHFYHGSKVSTWMYRIVVNTCIDFLRKKRNVVSLEEAVTKDEEKESAAAGQLQMQAIQARIHNSLRHLPLRQKNVVILKHFEGMTISQISAVLGCSQSSVKTHLVRAIRGLRKILEVNNELSQER